MSRYLKKIGILGHFGFGLNMTDGQTVKTVTFSDALKQRFGSDEIIECDTHGGWKFFLKLPFLLIKMLKKASNILIFPAQRGVRFIVPLLVFLNIFYKRRLHYCVIGGWLPKLLGEKRSLVKRLKEFSGIYVETTFVLHALNEMGLKNIYLVPNCKQLQVLKENDLPGLGKEPQRLCIFSRIMKEKGIEDAVFAVEEVNKITGREAFSLDIFGPVDPAQTGWFDKLSASFPKTVCYCGVVDFDKSTETLKRYNCLLFPTRFYTEGIPGTIIDAYAAGIPVISSRWQSFSDIIAEGVTGFGYSFEAVDELISLLIRLADDDTVLCSMRSACLRKGMEYLPDNALKELFARIG